MRLHHGVWVLGACSLLTVATSAGHSTGINIFVEFFIRDLGVSRTAFSGIWTVALAISSVMTPIAGLVLDRYGVRTTVALAGALQSVALVGLSHARSAMALALWFSLLRFSGPECLVVCGSTTVNRWFVRHRGKACAIKGFFDNLMMLFPAIMYPVLAAWGWRATLRGLAALFGALCAVGAAAVCDSPEDMGLLPDLRGGGSSRGGGKGGGAAGWVGVPGGSDGCDEEEGGRGGARHLAGRREEGKAQDWSFRAAIGTPVFWALTLTDSLYSLFWAGLNMHAFDFFALRGLAHSDVASLSIPFSVCLCAAALAGGSAVDRLSSAAKLRAFGLITVGLAGTMVLGCYATTWWRSAVFYVMYGALNGLKACVEQILMADLFGRASLGGINSVWIAFHTLSSGLGPLLFGWQRERTGDYVGVVQLLVLANLLGGFAMFAFMKPPRHARIEK